MPLLEHFLIVYNVRDAKLVHLEAFEHDVEAATTAYSEKEREYRDRDDNDDYEIVLIGADSLETVRVTHSRYFRGGSPNSRSAMRSEAWRKYSRRSAGPAPSLRLNPTLGE